jgi:hypothetical protein
LPWLLLPFLECKHLTGLAPPECSTRSCLSLPPTAAISAAQSKSTSPSGSTRSARTCTPTATTSPRCHSTTSRSRSQRPTPDSTHHASEQQVYFIARKRYNALFKLISNNINYIMA